MIVPTTGTKTKIRSKFRRLTYSVTANSKPRSKKTSHLRVSKSKRAE